MSKRSSERPLLTFGTSWARVEAGWHFPSDTLFSMALGNFFGSFVNDAFLGLEQSQVSLALAPTTESAMLQWNWTFSLLREGAGSSE